MLRRLTVAVFFFLGGTLLGFSQLIVTNRFNFNLGFETGYRLPPVFIGPVRTPPYNNVITDPVRHFSGPYFGYHWGLESRKHRLGINIGQDFRRTMLFYLTKNPQPGNQQNDEPYIGWVSDFKIEYFFRGWNKLEDMEFAFGVGFRNRGSDFLIVNTNQLQKPFTYHYKESSLTYTSVYLSVNKSFDKTYVIAHITGLFNQPIIVDFRDFIQLNVGIGYEL